MPSLASSGGRRAAAVSELAARDDFTGEKAPEISASFDTNFPEPH